MVQTRRLWGKSVISYSVRVQSLCHKVIVRSFSSFYLSNVLLLSASLSTSIRLIIFPVNCFFTPQSCHVSDGLHVRRMVSFDIWCVLCSICSNLPMCLLVYFFIPPLFRSYWEILSQSVEGIVVIYWNFKGNKAERVADILLGSCMKFMVVSDFKKFTHEREILVTCMIFKCEVPRLCNYPTRAYSPCAVTMDRSSDISGTVTTSMSSVTYTTESGVQP